MDIEPTVGLLQGLIDQQPVAAVILGSGLHHLGSEFQSAKRLPYDACPGFPRATAVGHVGEWVYGDWRGFRLLAMNGRFHLYEGYSIDQVTLPIRILHALQLNRIVISNAAGGLNPGYRQGDVISLDDQIDLTFCRESGTSPPQNELSQDGLSRLARPATSPYDAAWGESLRRFARGRGIELQQGIYIGLTGPTYETRSEYRALRRLGGDLVGMSTVWEAKIAARLGMAVQGLSVVTNVANPDRPAKTTAQEVIDTAHIARERVAALLEALLNSTPQ